LKSTYPFPASAAAPSARRAILQPGAWLPGVLCAVLLLAGCVTETENAYPGDLPETRESAVWTQTPPTVGDEEFMTYWTDLAQSSRAHRGATVRPPVAPAPAVEAAAEAEPPPVLPGSEPQLPQTQVSLVMRDAQVPDVLQALARAVDLNILVSPDVAGVTTVELRDVPWDQAFTGLLANLGLHYKWMGTILRVMTPEGLQKEVDIEKIEKDREQLRHDRRRVEPLLLQTIPVHYATATKLQPILEELLTSMDDYGTSGGTTSEGRTNRHRRGSVAVDEENNALVINALRDDILKMIEVVGVLDQPKDQVLIEAKIIIANRDTARELGFQWGGLYQGGHSAIFPGTDTTGVLGQGVDTPMSPVGGNISNFPSNAFTSTTTGTTGTTTTDTATNSLAGATGLSLGYAYQNLGDVILTAQLTALETDGKAEILATPSITVLDNEEATLKSGDEIPYQSYSDNQGTDVQFKEALLELTVTPHIIAGRMVKIKLLASNDEPDYSRVDTGITTEPSISRRSAETSLLLHDGETTVIGGLSRLYGSDSVSGVPVLMNLPWIGRFFRSTDREKRDEEMLIFITPHILGDRGSDSADAPASPAGETGQKDTPGAAEAPQEPAPETQTP